MTADPAWRPDTKGASFPKPAPEALAAALTVLRDRFGDRFSTGEAIRRQHAHTLTWGFTQPPDAVVFAESTEDVVAVVQTCAAHRVPVIPFGTGTSLEGQVNAPFGGVAVDLSRMNRIVAVHADDLDCVVEPGVTRKTLNAHLRDTGLFFPIDPGADASVGGMVSTRASGTNAVRFGTMKDNVLSLTVVTPTGEIVRTASRARKSAAGYDLTRLYVGAEGTLGIVTEITLKLYGLPEAVSAGHCSFPSVRAACETTIATIQMGLPVARIELVDVMGVRAMNLHSGLSLPESPLLLVEFHGTETGVAEQAERFQEIAEMNGASEFTWATRPEDRTKLWDARHNLYWATLGLRPGVQTVATDVCVPISRLADCIEETAADLAATGMLATINGHVGDGNFHVSPLIDFADPDEVVTCKAFIERLVRRGLAMGGTCTGEHGIGQMKMKYLPEEHAPATLDVMRAVKSALDPLGIMNPGKIPG